MRLPRGFFSRETSSIPRQPQPRASLRSQAFWIAVLAVLVGPGCRNDSPPDPPRRPNVLLVTFDTLRADHTTPYGYSRPTTPGLAALAAEGTVFDAAYAVTPTTLPSHATLFTSLYPDEHGWVRNGIRLAPKSVTMAQLFRSHGYKTAGFVSSVVVSVYFGIDAGFDDYDDRMEGKRKKLQRNAQSTTDQVLDWLSRQTGEQPFFLWVHYMDPHWPYDPPEPFRSQFAAAPGSSESQREIGRYDAEIRFADQQLSRIVANLKQRGGWDDTLAIVTADHGQGLGQHGWPTHGPLLYEEAVRVPLIVRWPGHIPSGRRVAFPTGLIDLLPSVLGLLDLEIPAGLRGHDFSKVWTGESEGDPKPVFFQREEYEGHEVKSRSATIPVAGAKWGVRHGRWKLIVAPDEQTLELYDLVADPGELENVAPHNPETVRSLMGVVDDWRAQASPGERPTEHLDEDLAEKLRALGYGQ